MLLLSKSLSSSSSSLRKPLTRMMMMMRTTTTTKKNKRTNALFTSLEGSFEKVVTNQGVVTRRATLGTSHVSRRRLRRRTRSAAAAILLLESHRTERDEAHRVGATVRFRGKEYDHDASGRRGERTKGVHRNGRCAGVIGYGAGVDGREREKVFGGFGW